MKFNKVGLIGALCAVGLLGTTLAQAATSTVPVTANVVGTCKFLTAGAVNFVLDPSTTTAATGAVTAPTFWCTKGSTYSIGADNGANASGTQKQMKNTSTTELIKYSLGISTPTGTGSGPATAITLALTASVANVDFIGASAGSYADSVVLTITP